MNIVIKMILVALAAVFPKFKKGYGMFLIILMSFISMLFFIGAALDQSADQPDWVVRNMRFFGVGALVVGWVLGIALMRQAARHEAILKADLDEYERKRGSEST
ncbi:hypothetical protein [Planktotalea sp.]|uniref:hypothetical protein n=1 Tax=Planktotalea sp. TaxID=2029877 RepID=UPI0025EA6430|nr:hypothetical protein [Planktotalea sp.]